MIDFGEIGLESFLRDYWQQKPLLIRQGLPGFFSPLEPDELAGLACEEEVESRIVLENGSSGPWELQHGPFSEHSFSTLPDSHWTLLVQAVDQYVEEVWEMLDNFRFIPDWRIDDVMVSYAAKGGSVGPHFDQYDVFLVQGLGCRRWQIGPLCDVNTPLRDDTKLGILTRFNAEQSYDLYPGDILYVPPGYAHHGVAQDDCMTYSIGFRAPSRAELLGRLADAEEMRESAFERLTDSRFDADICPAEIRSQDLAQVQTLLREAIDDPTRLAPWFGAMMTETKYNHCLPDAGPEDIESLLELLKPAQLVQRSPDSRLAFFRIEGNLLFFFNGEVIECCTSAAQELAIYLCEERVYDGGRLQAMDTTSDTRELLRSLLEQEVLMILDE